MNLSVNPGDVSSNSLRPWRVLKSSSVSACSTLSGSDHYHHECDATLGSTLRLAPYTPNCSDECVYVIHWERKVIKLLTSYIFRDFPLHVELLPRKNAVHNCYEILYYVLRSITFHCN